MIKQGDSPVMLVWTGENIAGLNPSNGEAYWKIPFEKKKMIMNVASPVVSSPYVFLTAFFDGSFLLKLDRQKPAAELLWQKVGRNERETIALHSTISTPVIKDGYVYGIDSYGEVRCLDLLTGERIWEDKSLVRQGRWSNIHFIEQDEKVWAFTETGELILGEFSPEGFLNYGSVKLIDPVRISPNPRGGVCWAIPAFYGNRIIVRNDEKVVCYEVGTLTTYLENH
jgi:outer membrane protein assembly factor BamB